MELELPLTLSWGDHPVLLVEEGGRRVRIRERFEDGGRSHRLRNAGGV